MIQLFVSTELEQTVLLNCWMNTLKIASPDEENRGIFL